MKIINSVLSAIPRALSSKPSIFIFIGLFVYLFGFGLLGLTFKSLEPSARMQLILGNYTNVTSAAGASIAAGAGLTTVATTATVLSHVRKNNKKYDELKRSHDEMRKLVDEIRRHTVSSAKKQADEIVKQSLAASGTLAYTGDSNEGRK